MGWVNARQSADLVFERDPNDRTAIALGRSILRRVQGVGLHAVLGADGAPETSYGGSHAPQVQPLIIGAATGVRPPSLGDLGGADIATGVTEANSGASRAFAERLRRGRVVT